MEFIERSNHYLELNDDGTYKKHFSKFGHVGGQQIRIDIDPVTKMQTPTFIAVKNVIEVVKATGEIKNIKRDFDPKREILGPEIHDDPLLQNIIVEAIDYPEDMEGVDTITKSLKINYKYDKVTKKLKKKV